MEKTGYNQLYIFNHPIREKQMVFSKFLLLQLTLQTSHVFWNKTLEQSLEKYCTASFLAITIISLDIYSAKLLKVAGLQFILAFYFTFYISVMLNQHNNKVNLKQELKVWNRNDFKKKNLKHTQIQLWQNAQKDSLENTNVWKKNTRQEVGSLWGFSTTTRRKGSL